MGEKTINVVIAGRSYPVTVNPGDEGKVEAAALKISGIIREFEKNYAVKDRQDLLAMCALQLATEPGTRPVQPADTDNTGLERLLAIEKILDSTLG